METEILQERLELAVERIGKIEEEQSLPEAFEVYFHRVARFLMGEEEEKEHYYAQSYLNPIYAGEQLGEELGGFLSALYYEMYSLTGLRGQEELQESVIRMELFLEIYGIFMLEWQENQRLPEFESLRQCFYWFAFDYADVAAEKYVKELVAPAKEEYRVSCLDVKSVLYGFLPELPGAPAEKEVLNVQEVLKEQELWSRDADHIQDVALVLDKAYVSRKLEVFRTALEQQKELKQQKSTGIVAQSKKGIPTRISIQSKNPDAISMNRDQKKLWSEYCRQAENIWKEHCFLTEEI